MRLFFAAVFVAILLTAAVRAVTIVVPEKGTFLLVDLDICRLTVYVDGVVIETFPVSGGQHQSPSPVGTWMVTEIADWGEGFGGSWIGLNVPWGQYGIHGTIEPWSLGAYNASKGCIRMHNDDVAIVKNLVTLGTIVHIKFDGVPFRAMESGMIGSDVFSVQQTLHQLGYYPAAADGVFGDVTENAVRAFQKINHLAVDGIVGRRTYEKLVRLSKEQKNSPVLIPAQ
ncbi:peptidoglycan-binding protein [Oscillospiraceae bacterium WX1]